MSASGTICPIRLVEEQPGLFPSALEPHVPAEQTVFCPGDRGGQPDMIRAY